MNQTQMNLTNTANVAGKTALITGGARGIGKAIALEFARNGYHVVINYLGSEQKALEVMNQCLSFGVQTIVHRCDVSKAEQVEEMFQSVVARFGRIDVLINNAGITKDNLMLRMSEADFDDVLDTNLKGTFLCAKQAIRYMMKQRSGSIVNVSSVVGLMGNVGQVNYAASKAGVVGLTKSLAKEVASRNVRVNAVAPGYIESDMSAAVAQEMQDKAKGMIPLQAFGKPEDVAHTVCFLASEKAKYITGQVIQVDGGLAM